MAQFRTPSQNATYQAQRPFPSTQLLSLPPELLLRILTFLPARDITKCVKLCRCLWSLFRNSSTLKYIQECDLSGVEDNPDNLLSHAEKLRMLRNREYSWANCRPDFSKMAPAVDFSLGYSYDLAGHNGVYTMGVSTRDKLKYFRLPSKPDDVMEWLTFEPKAEWTEHKDIVDYRISLHEHDLIALLTTKHAEAPGMVEVELSLHQFSTGKYHPLAARPLIPLTRGEVSWGPPAIACEVSGQYLVLTLNFWFNPLWRSSVWVFQWTTGQQLLYIEGEPESHEGVAFLNEDHILIPNPLSNTIEIWKIPQLGDDPSTSPVQVLGLPSLEGGHIFDHISCRSEPNPTLSGSTFNPDKPFHVSSKNSIIILHLIIDTDDGACVTIIVHRSSLLELAQRQEELSVLYPTPIPWEAWGPSKTCCVDNGDVPWITISCGQRVVILPSGTPEAPIPLRVYDFGKVSVKKVEKELEKLNEEEKLAYNGPVVKRKTVLSDATVKYFQGPITSCLPYVESRTEKLYDISGAMMDEERIIAIKTDAEDNITSMEILHFG